MFTQFEVKTNKRSELVEITDRIQDIVGQWKIKNGTCLIFVPHTTAGITINEQADPSVQDDILSKLDDLVPWEDNYRHGEGNAAAHVKTSLMGSSEELIIKDSNLVLGTWQGIFLAEFDGPRNRKVEVKLIRE